MGFIYPGIVIPSESHNHAFSWLKEENEKRVRVAIRSGRLPKDKTLLGYVVHPEKIMNIDVDDVGNIVENGYDCDDNEEEVDRLREREEIGPDGKRRKIKESSYEIIDLPTFSNIQELPIEVILRIIIESGELSTLLKVNKFFYNAIKMNEISLKFRIIYERYIHVVEYKKNRSTVKPSIYQYSQASTADIEFHHENALRTPMDLTRLGDNATANDDNKTHDSQSNNIFKLPKIKKPIWEFTVLDSEALGNSCLTCDMLSHISPECIQTSEDIDRFKAFVEKEDENKGRLGKLELINKFQPAKIPFPFVDHFEEGDKIYNHFEKRQLFNYLFVNKHKSVQSVDKVLFYYFHILKEDENWQWLLISKYTEVFKYIRYNLIEVEKERVEQNENENENEESNEQNRTILRNTKLLIFLLERNILGHFRKLVDFYDKEELSQDDYLWNYVKDSKKWRYFKVLKSQGIEPHTRFLGS